MLRYGIEKTFFFCYNAECVMGKDKFYVVRGTARTK